MEPARHLRDIVAATKPRRGDAPEDASPADAEPWTRPNLSGRLVELRGGRASAALTFAVALVLDAQRRGETAAWVTSRASCFFPPDAAAVGVDLAALPVVRVPLAGHVARAGERLLRSGAFDLIVLDLDADADPPQPLLSRMLGLAEKHDAAVVFLVEKARTARSLSPLVSLRVEASRGRADDDGVACELEAVRDKRRPGGWTHVVRRRAPDGPKTG